PMWTPISQPGLLFVQDGDGQEDAREEDRPGGPQAGQQPQGHTAIGGAPSVICLWWLVAACPA
ncbi:hypothetical protein P7K49_005986, partial [Saguinus oedipus]